MNIIRPAITSCRSTSTSNGFETAATSCSNNSSTGFPTANSACFTTKFNEFKTAALQLNTALQGFLQPQQLQSTLILTAHDPHPGSDRVKQSYTTCSSDRFKPTISRGIKLLPDSLLMTVVL